MVPVIVYSQHFERTVLRFLPIACGFGFDGYLPRGLFRGSKEFSDSKQLTLNLWNLVYARARSLRERAVLGEAFDMQTIKSLNIRLHDDLKKWLNDEFEGWGALVDRMFHFSESVVLTQLRGGWSGASVLQAFAQQPMGRKGGTVGD